MTETAMRRPDLITLSGRERGRVLKHLARHRARCGACGGDDFEIGNVLYLGFLFRSEDHDAYMIALTCTNPECAAPRTGLRLPGSDFLTDTRTREQRGGPTG